MQTPKNGDRLSAADGTVYVIKAVHEVPAERMGGEDYPASFWVELVAEEEAEDIAARGQDLTEREFGQFCRKHQLKPA